MSISVPKLKRYTKKNAQKIKRFGSDPLSIDLSEIVPDSTSLAVVRSRKDYKRYLKSDYGFVLNQRNNQLVYNQNGSDKGFGKGGVIVKFKKNLLVDETSFVLNSDVSSDGSATDAPTSNESPSVVNESGVSTGTGESSGSGAIQSLTQPPASVASSLSQESIYGEISYRGEEDLYEIDVPVGHKVFLSTTGDVQSYVLVVDSDGNELASGGVFDTTTYVKGDQDIYAKVVAYGGQTGSYELQIDSDLSDALKRASSPRLIQSPPSGELIYDDGRYYVEMDDVARGEIDYEGESDYFKLEVQPGNVVCLTLNTIESDVYPEVSIVDAEGNSLIRGSTVNSGFYEPYREVTGSGVYEGSHFSRVGPYDVITGTTDLYAKVGFSRGEGSYALNYEIHQSPSAVLELVESLVNEERSKVGAQPLSRNGALDQAAGGHSSDMLLNNYQSHTGFNGSSPSTRARNHGHPGYVGENIHTTHSAFTAMQAWMNSSGHRDNLLKDDYVEIGLGCILE